MTALGKITVHLLTVVLLVCPYICLSSPAARTVVPSTREVGAGCCNSCSRPVEQGSQSGEEGEDRPGQPDSRQGSGACLCHGAVMDRHVETPDPEHTVVAFLTADAMAAADEPSSQDERISPHGVAFHSPAVESGRELRALIASLLL